VSALVTASDSVKVQAKVKVKVWARATTQSQLRARVCAMALIDAGALNSDCLLSHFVTARKTVP
jgi:hypothetical protein